MIKSGMFCKCGWLRNQYKVITTINSLCLIDHGHQVADPGIPAKDTFAFISCFANLPN